MSRGVLILLIVFACAVSACRTSPAPSAERSAYKSSYKVTRDGHYRVRRGDTLHAIAFNFGLDWREIASWNHIGSPYTIYPDQELRLSPPPGFTSGNPTRKSTSTSSAASSKPASPPPSTPVERKQSQATTTALKTPSATTTNKVEDRAPVKTPTPAATGEPSSWRWPVKGRIVSNFKPNDPARNGIEIGGKEGQAIVASAGGEVVYSGNGLIGYGELIIIKHSDRLLSAYAHNRKRLVSEGQTVKAGERIAEMGRNGRNQALLHFEIRVNGTPNDPLKFLP